MDKYKICAKGCKDDAQKRAAEEKQKSSVEKYLNGHSVREKLLALLVDLLVIVILVFYKRLLNCAEDFEADSSAIMSSVTSAVDSSVVEVISLSASRIAEWTLTVDLERIQANEMRCFRKLLGISYRDRVTNEEMGDRIRQAIGLYEELLATVKKTQNEMVLACYTINRACQDNQARLLCKEGEGEKDRKRWEDNISDWTGLKLSNTEWNGGKWLSGHQWCPMVDKTKG